jgi:hypothetical protein
VTYHPRWGELSPLSAPSFVELKLDAYYNWPSGIQSSFDRPLIAPRIVLVHTNGATKEGSIESAINWGNASPANTKPHYQIDRHRAAKLVPSDRKAIGNARIADYSIVIETADEGWPVPGNAGGFIGEQIEMLAEIIAYECTLSGIPIAYPSAWDGTGVGCHTEPFGYPHWTTVQGKPCPGDTKKRQVRELVLPLAAELATIPEPEPPEEPDEMLEYIARRADFQAHPNDPWIYVLGASCRAAVSEDFKYHPIPVVDIADVNVQYANLKKSAGL